VRDLAIKEIERKRFLTPAVIGPEP